MKVELFAVLFVFLVVVFFCGRGCVVNKSVAYDAAEKAGFTEIQVLDSAWFFVAIRGCSGSDAAKFSVSAKNSNDKQVTFDICTGMLFKNATIRY